MRICVLQSSYDSGHILQQHDDDPSRPGNFTDRHTFEERWIHKETAKEEIDAAVAEGFDLFFNFLWGQHEDRVAGIDAIKYLESLAVPVMGMPSRIQERSKNDFYRDAAQAGVRVPETYSASLTDIDYKFPVMVKPAKCCGSMFVSEDSVCWNKEQVQAQKALLNEKLAPGREIAASAARKTVNGDSTVGQDSTDDVVVQEFIDGKDYAVIVLEMMDTPIPLNPTRYIFPPSLRDQKKPSFLTLDTKFHPELAEELVERVDNPELYDKLQNHAVMMWKANKMQGGNWGNADIRVRNSDGELVGIEVNPMPAVFLQTKSFEDVVIEAFPGGHKALIDILIETTIARHTGAGAKDAGAVMKQMGSTYENIVEKYPADVHVNLLKAYTFSGTVLDVGAGTGLFPRLWHEHIATHAPELKAVFHAIGISPEAIHLATPNGAPLYEKVLIGPMQQVLPTITEQHDHVVCIGLLHFLSPTQLSLSLARMFQLAKRSVTISIEDIPETYNETLREPYIASHNHIDVVENLKSPKGWKKVPCDLGYFWVSAHTQKKVHAKYYRWEAI